MLKNVDNSEKESWLTTWVSSRIQDVRNDEDKRRDYNNLFIYCDIIWEWKWNVSYINLCYDSEHVFIWKEFMNLTCI